MVNSKIESLDSIWGRFEYIACICFTGYKDRQISIIEELKRVGLLNKVHFFWDFPSPYTKVLAQRLCKDSYHQKMFPVGYNNYRAIKTAYELGYSSILVMEDDIRFLKDLRLLAHTIRSLPEYEIAMLDKNFPGDVRREFLRMNDRVDETDQVIWRKFSTFHSSGCYSLSRTGMQKFIRAYEFDGMRQTLKNNDQYFNNSVFSSDKMYAAFPNVVLQSIVGNLNHLSPLDEYIMMNEYQGGQQNMYNISYPYVNKMNFLDLLYRATERSMQDEALKTFCRGNTIFCGKCSVESRGIQCATDGTSFTSKPDGVRCSSAIIWGNGDTDSNIMSLQLALRDNIPVVLCEDGFIRSYTTWVDRDSPNYKRLSHSYVFDSNAYYFDALKISGIERMLNDTNVVVSPTQIEEARRLIGKIVSNKISKYNHQPIVTPNIGRDGTRKVLVVDQSYGDFSIKRGMADDSTFEKMLQAAINENPDADILVKTHPDTIAGKKAEKKGYYQDIKEHNNIYKVTKPINPYSLIEVCDKVYVCTSQFGLEAVMAGKEVHVFGMPFYAGWGLTIDDQHLDRRTNKRTLEELFYIFYCMYTHWVDPDKGCETTIDAVIDKMIALREEYHKNISTKIISRESYLRNGDGFGYQRPTLQILPRIRQ
ncbi:MAG: hypothetical protein J6Q22_10015 [Prevotella sp.]|nr:hypothetical protein [Prevotella sp.]